MAGQHALRVSECPSVQASAPRISLVLASTRGSSNTAGGEGGFGPASMSRAACVLPRPWNIRRVQLRAVHARCDTPSPPLKPLPNAATLFSQQLPLLCSALLSTSSSTPSVKIHAARNEPGPHAPLRTLFARLFVALGPAHLIKHKGPVARIRRLRAPDETVQMIGEIARMIDGIAHASCETAFLQREHTTDAALQTVRGERRRADLGTVSSESGSGERRKRIEGERGAGHSFRRFRSVGE
eukprot:6208008-Pleurochrysis_carterae.AAC.1